MRALLFTAILALAMPAIAQNTDLPDGAPRDPKGVLSSQRLTVTDKGMVYAVERLDRAAQEDQGTALSGAFDESREAVTEVRSLVRPLPENERAPFEAAASEAEAVLKGGDPRAGAEAMRELRRRVLDLVAARG